ncbi:mis18-binding protein 1-like [Pseudophryne corroboree]|uniref:mis18-binding protein 1-like n=1 Tax=Pseudophryne corroboree TaxID=495146 RepID=UPI00308205FB
MAVGSRSAPHCQEKYMERQQTKGSKAQAKKKVNSAKKKADAAKMKLETNSKEKETVEITANVGTLKRKRQMREFLDQMEKDDHDDLFSDTMFQSMKVKLPTMSASSQEFDFQLPEQSPTTPTSPPVFPIARTPECEYLSPGMLEPINMDENDKYVYRLQKSHKWDKIMCWDKLKKRSRDFYHQKSTLRMQFPNKDIAKPTFIRKLFEKVAPEMSDNEEEKDYYFSDVSEEK